MSAVLRNHESLERRVLDLRAVRRIVMELVTHARFEFDRSEFEAVARASTAFAQRDGNALQGRQNEKCFW